MQPRRPGAAGREARERREAPSAGGCWPTPRQELLLRACLADRPAGLAAWNAWWADGPEADETCRRLLPLAWPALRDAPLPADAAALLAEAHRAALLANLALFGQAAQALSALRAAGVRVVLLKGVALALLHYPDPGARPMGDVDLLVAPADAGRAADALAAAGWRGGRPEEWRRHGQHACNFSHRATGALLDLHEYALHDNRTADADAGLLAAARPCRLGGVEALAPSAADLLLLAVAHGLHWMRHPTAYWMADAALLLRGGGIDWARLAREAAGRRLGHTLRKGLEGLERVLPGSVPSEAWSALGARPAPLAERIEHWFRARPPDGILGSLPRLWFAHARGRRALGRRPGPVSFARELQQRWRAPGAAGLAVLALRKTGRRLGLRRRAR